MRSPKRKLRRALVDDQFDRTDVEAQQWVKLTVTNCPFGLTIKYYCAHIMRCFPKSALQARQYSIKGAIANLNDLLSAFPAPARQKAES